ncbi:MAG: helix-turn-helix domain-containing protein [Chloroflexi bacterium]|nr:helix-turn-helix domain-containing protein [Chloroflexota bacterium]
MVMLLMAAGLTLLALVTLTSYTLRVRRKRLRRMLKLTPLSCGLLLTMLVRAADTPFIADSWYQNHMTGILQILGVGLAVIGGSALLPRVRFSRLLRPPGVPFAPEPTFESRYGDSPSIPVPALPLVDSSTHLSTHLMSLGEAARFLHISEHDVWQLVDEGSITATRTGGGYLIARRALDDFLRHERFGLN